MKFIKNFENHQGYEAYVAEDYPKPNVSYCVQENEVHYNPIGPFSPNNIIRYEASEKLTETTSDKSSGLHTNKFGTTMASHTFENGVGTIEFEDSVTSIGNYAFYKCSSLNIVTIPNSVTSIGDNVFDGCSSLTSVTIPNGVTSIGNFAFSSCSSLTSIAIPNGVTSIGGSAFYGCSGLTSIDIPNSVTSLLGQAFALCTSLTSVTIPNSVTSIGEAAFGGCSSLTSVTVEAATHPTLGSKAFNNTNNCPIYVPSESVETYKSASGWSDYASRIQAIP